VLRSRGDIDQHELAVAAILVEIWARDDEHDGLAVGGDLRVGNGSDLRVIVQFEVTRLREGGPARKEGCQQQKGTEESISWKKAWVGALHHCGAAPSIRKVVRIQQVSRLSQAYAATH
jgi:hypothetical protein